MAKMAIIINFEAYDFISYNKKVFILFSYFRNFHLILYSEQQINLNLSVP